jgi:hypothetical protein
MDEIPDKLGDGGPSCGKVDVGSRSPRQKRERGYFTLQEIKNTDKIMNANDIGVSNIKSRISKSAHDDIVDDGSGDLAGSWRTAFRC